MGGGGGYTMNVEAKKSDKSNKRCVSITALISINIIVFATECFLAI